MGAVVDTDAERSIGGLETSRGGPGGAGWARFDARALVVLQLVARGYSVVRIAQLRGEPLEHIIASLHDTLAALDSTTVRDAVRAAQHRGLIV
jgi:hypothetical protein